MIEKGLMFNGVVTDKMNTKEAFLTKYVSEVERLVITSKKYLVKEQVSLLWQQNHVQLIKILYGRETV